MIRSQALAAELEDVVRKLDSLEADATCMVGLPETPEGGNDTPGASDPNIGDAHSDGAVVTRADGDSKVALNTETFKSMLRGKSASGEWGRHTFDDCRVGDKILICRSKESDEPGYYDGNFLDRSVLIEATIESLEQVEKGTAATLRPMRK